VNWVKAVSDKPCLQIGQWLVLKKYEKLARKWLLASIVTAFAIFIAYDTHTASLMNWPLAGLILGTTQAFCLYTLRKKKAVERKT
jgi:hypothetical protein